MEAFRREKHQYEVGNKDLGAMVQALKMGVTAGHTTGIAFEGSAWARYDQWVGNNETDQLPRYAKEPWRAGDQWRHRR